MANAVLTFAAGLCLMGRDGELIPYDTAAIEAASQTDAIRLARQWAQDAALAEDSHLQVLLNGKAVVPTEAGRVLTEVRYRGGGSPTPGTWEPIGLLARPTGMTDQVIYAMGGAALLMTAVILISLSQMI